MKYYVLLKHDELITIKQVGDITLSRSRFIKDLMELEVKLIALGINKSDDYVVGAITITHSYDLSSMDISLRVFALEKIFFLADSAQMIFKRTLATLFKEKLCSIKEVKDSFDCEYVIKKSQRERIKNILSDGDIFALDVSGDFARSIDELEQESSLQALKTFKREATINDGIVTFLNDIITLALLARNGDLRESYIAGEDIAQCYYKALKEEYSKVTDVGEMLLILKKHIDEHRGDSSHIITKLNKFAKDEGEDGLIIKFLYLAIKDAFNKKEEVEFFEAVVFWYKKLIENESLRKAVQYAYGLFFLDLHYADIGDGYERYKSKCIAKRALSSAPNMTDADKAVKEESCEKQKIREIFRQDEADLKAKDLKLILRILGTPPSDLQGNKSKLLNKLKSMLKDSSQGESEQMKLL